MDRKQTIDLLAEHFTGPQVAHNSLSLQVGGHHAKMAKLFFDTRKKLGINGYATKEEAEAALNERLG